MANNNITAPGNRQPAKANVRDFINSPEMQKKIQDLLKERSSQFTTSILSLVSADPNLSEAVPATVFTATLTAASLDLPINKNLGFAWIVAYKDNRKGITEAQFQMGWKGYVQLAQRSGQYKTINVTDVREGEMSTRDRLSGEITFNWIDDDVERETQPIIGYVAYFKLHTGFEKMLYMSRDEVDTHARTYSKAYQYDLNKGYKTSKWSTDFDAMARKTVIRLLIGKFGPMSAELQKAYTSDQAVIDGELPVYVDNDGGDYERAVNKITAATDPADIMEVMNGLSPELITQVTPHAEAKVKELEGAPHED